MLHDISPQALRVGMYITSFNEGWMAVPFWRRRFLVADEQTRAKVVASGISTITIDDTRGLGPTVAAPPSPPVEEEVAASPPRLERRRVARPTGAVDEYDRARQILARSKAAIIDMFAEARLGHAVAVTSLEPLVDEIAASVARDQHAMLSVTRLKNKNEYTYLHSVAVCALMMSLARQLGWPAAAVRRAGLAGMLHDIGKMAVPATLLDKPGKLEADERQIVQGHPEHGHALLRRSGDIEEAVLDVCLHHHERIDGRGYPHGLTGGELSEIARMGAICDVYDAVTSDRPYKRPWSPSEALAQMLSWEGHFDPRLLHAFITSLGIYPIGGLVRLHSNRLAIVVRDDPRDATTPIVRAFHAADTGLSVPVEDVGTDAAGDRVLQGENWTRWFGADWADLAQRVGAAAPGARVEVLSTGPGGAVMSSAAA